MGKIIFFFDSETIITAYIKHEVSIFRRFLAISADFLNDVVLSTYLTKLSTCGFVVDGTVDGQGQQGGEDQGGR